MPTTVTIGPDTYDVYVTPAQVDTYANGSLTASAWEDLTADDKSRVVVSVTRWIDSQCWQGEKLDPLQPLAWPRTVGDIATIEQAAIMLSVLLAANPSLMDEMTGATVAADGGTKRLKAGSVEIEYFRKLNFGFYSTGSLQPFPRNVMGLLSAYLCGNGNSAWGLSGSSAFGTCEPSRVGTWDRYGFWRPL
jgi:hypothetical protein